MATNWTVLVFGDSWAEYMHPTWPQVLGRRLSAQTHNFAQAGSLCGDLGAQAQRAMLSPQVPKVAGGLLRPETLVVVHTCGNDFIMKMAEALMGGGLLGGMLGGGGGMGGGGFGAVGNPEILRANPGAREAGMLAQFLDTMYRGGARHFLVSGVPAFLEMPIFNLLWPIIAGMVNAGKLEDLGVGPGDPPQLAMQVQATSLHERWSELVETFGRAHSDATCVFFDEVGALERLRESMGAPTFDRSMWDMSMFHPTAFGHEQLATEAHRCVMEHFATLSALFQHSTPVQPKAPMAQPAAQPQAQLQGQAGAQPKAGEGQGSVLQAEEAAKGSAAAPGSCPITLRIRNVKGDISFAVAGDAHWHVQRLREAVLAAAPSGFAPAGTACVLAVKGKFLGDGPETLTELGLCEGAQVIAVARPASATPGGSRPQSAAG
mmetsp:Transcript_81794/g.226610  ORF Transcript_81794/g.226610 Transcript_81794/m.226610 type:complete len:433 (-) Transcript_81794:111-1409(-)